MSGAIGGEKGLCLPKNNHIVFLDAYAQGMNLKIVRCFLTSYMAWNYSIYTSDLIQEWFYSIKDHILLRNN